MLLEVLVNLPLGVTLQWTSILSRGVEILLMASCYRNWDKLQSDEPCTWLTRTLLPVFPTFLSHHHAAFGREKPFSSAKKKLYDIYSVQGC